ncbi:hypothetical protein B0181_06110 [Moraxella caviae]|nr:hypothetical protein B0181_06110 [Moraxella caviae]
MTNGWMVLDGEYKCYLPLGDVDNFDWQRSKIINDKELIEICERKFYNKEIVGLVVTWKDTNIGGELLFFLDGRVSFLLTINRIENAATKLTDFQWYLEKIIPAFLNNDIYIESIECSHMI